MANDRSIQIPGTANVENPASVRGLGRDYPQLKYPLDRPTIQAIRLALGDDTGDEVLGGGGGGSPEIFLPAEAMNPTTTAGCASLAKVEAGTNDVDYWVLAFDATTAESCFFTIRMPDNWDAGNVTFRFIWTNAAGLTTETVDWGIKGRCYADSDAIDQAYGTEVVTTDTWLAQNDIHISAESSEVTPSGTLAAGNWCQFKLTRKTGTDNMTGDARLIGVRLNYGTT